MEFLMDLDGNILLWIQEFIRQEWMHCFWKGITMLGDGGWFWILCSFLLLIPRQTRRIGITAFIALFIGALITNVALKNLVARIRPYEVIDGLVLLVDRQRDFSFPSGHTCASFAAGVVYWKMMPRKYGIPFLVLAVLIAFSRLYVGVHYPTDVLGGLAVGIFSACTALKLMQYISGRRQKEQEKQQT